MAKRIDTPAARITKGLQLKGITQAELSRQTGIDKATISLYVHGKYEPSGTKAIALSHALGTSPEWILGFDVPMIKEITPVKNELDESEKMLLELFRRIPSDKRQMALEMLKAALQTD